MKVELFTLCQGAYNNSGQLTIVNTIDNFSVPSFPVRLSFGLALKFYILPDEEGDKQMTISIMNTKQTNIVVPPIPAKLHINRCDRASHIGIALNLQNVLFEAPGIYNVHLEIDGKRFDDFAFEVEQKMNIDNTLVEGGFSMNLSISRDSNPIEVSQRDLNIRMVRINHTYWNRASNFMSSNNFDNVDFEKIVSMGEDAVPGILEIIRERPDPIVYALDRIFPGYMSYDGYVSLEDVCNTWIITLLALGKV